MKDRIILRLHFALRDILEREAAWQGTRLGTLTSQIIHRQAEEARRQGAGYRLNPVGELYVPLTYSAKNSATGETSGKKQVSIFVTGEDLETITRLAEKSRGGVRYLNGQRRISYRQVIPGMLLNDPIFAELEQR